MPAIENRPEHPPGKSPHIRRRSELRTHSRVLETTAKLGVNLVLAVAATSGLVRLLPLHQSVQDKLIEIQTEVKRTEARVHLWQREFNRAFDPQQAKSVMLEESHRVDSQRRPIVLMQGANLKDPR